MSSSGIQSISSGPLIIRTYNDSTSSDVTYLLKDYDYPVSSNYVLITSTNGQLVPSDNIYISSITISSINGLPYAPSDDVFWSGNLAGDITNDNTGNVRITTNLDCSSIINISSIFTLNTLNISSNQTYLTANKFKYFSTDPSTIDTFKIDLSGSNLLIYNSTISTFDATFVQNSGGGQLVLATDEPIMYINGSANGNNHIGIGTSNPLAALHITDTNFSQVFTTSGTFVVPVGITSVNFELIGAGGPIGNPGTPGGTGGYIKGTMNVFGFIGSTINVIVGNVGQNPPPTGIASGASYITIPSIGPLFVIAGAGGSSSGAGVPQNGGWGGGGTFVSVSPNNYVANGGDGQTSGGGQGGQGGQGSAGGTGGSCAGYPGNPGGGRPVIPDDYQQALGGTGVLASGGSGYTGGGEGCGAGGGSSYYNSLYTTITTSYPGNTLPAGILQGYGRSEQNGYVRISYLNGEPSLVTSGAVGIGTTDPQALLDIQGTLSTLSIIDNTGSLGTTGQVLTAGPSGAQVIWSNTLNVLSISTTSISTTSISTSTINGLPYPPQNDTFWSTTLNGDIINTNTGNVNISTALNVNGYILTNTSYILYNVVIPPPYYATLSITQSTSAGFGYINCDYLTFRNSNSGGALLSLNTTASTVNVQGDIYATGNITAGSDIRFKTAINTLENSLSTVKNLRGVSYTTIDTQRKNIGVIAQEIEQFLPEVVITDDSSDHFKSVAYGNIVGILIEAIKELSGKVDNLEKLIHTT
jgi:hypothetical protein